MSLNIVINSREKTFGNASDFEIQTNLNNLTLNTGFRLNLKSFTMPFLEYPINSKNNSLVFQENGSASNLVATFTAGSYSSADIISSLTAALQSSGSNTYTITFNNSTKKLTIASSGTIKIISGGLLYPIGFSAGSLFSASVTGTYPVRLSGSDWIDIYSNLITNNYVVGPKQKGSLLARVPTNLLYGDLIDYVSYDTFFFEVTNDESILNLNIQLYDEFGALMELPANCYCSVVLTVNYNLDA